MARRGLPAGGAGSRDIELGRRHWLAAVAGALAIHGLVAGVWLWQAPQSGAVSAGLGGVSVSLGPAGGAPGSVASSSDATSEAAPVEAPEAVEETLEETVAEVVEATPPDPTDVPVETAVEPAPEVPVEPLETQVAEVPAVEPPPEPELAKPIEPETTPATVAAAVVPPPPPKPRDLPEAPRKPVRQPQPEPEPQAKPEAPAPAAQVAALPDAQPSPGPSAPAGAGGRSGAQAAPQAGSGDSQSGGGLPGASADYFSLLQAWLEKHKEYPRRAQARRQEGTVLLHFVMDRDGHVLQYRIQRSSGHGLLDAEVEEMIQRADPLPPMPEEMPDARLELVIPVQFLLH